MKLIVAVLLCAIIGISKAKSVVETETEVYQDEPANDEVAMLKTKQNMFVSWKEQKKKKCFDSKRGAWPNLIVPLPH